MLVKKGRIGHYRGILTMLRTSWNTRLLARLLIFALLLTSVSAGPASAALISTEQAVAGAAADAARGRLSAFLERAEVRAEFVALGLDPNEAAARVARLSDAEVVEVAGRLDELPAGEGALGAVVGAALFIFIVLLITDLLGLTDVFPFVRR